MRTALAMWIALLLLAAPSMALSAEPEPDLRTVGECTASMPPEHAERVLRETTVFAAPYVGFAGSISEQACAFASLQRRADAAAIYQRLLRSAKPAGQLYALCGLFLTTREGFARAVGPFRESKQRVQTWSACIRGEDMVGALVKEIENGAWPWQLRDFGVRMAERRTR